MTAPAAFACTCGALGGEISEVSPRSGTHAECFCDSCRAAEIHLGQPDPRPDGVHLFQLTPDMVTITRGKEHLAVLQLNARGPLRWYAACCGSTLFNTLRSPGLPFATMAVARLAEPEAVGRVMVKSFVRGRDGKQTHQGAALMVWRIATRMGAARLSGRWKQTPFFDIATGKPVAKPHLLTAEERSRAFRS